MKNRCAQAWGRAKDSLQVATDAFAAIWRRTGTETAVEGEMKMQQPQAETVTEGEMKMQWPQAETEIVGDEYPIGREDW
jgi:hypothetical protein